MLTESQKLQISITLDADLLDQIDKLTDNRTAAVEEGLRLWYAKQIEDNLRKFYETRSQADIEVEEEWATFAREQMEEILSEEAL